jgi:hypothetical protein
VATVWGEAVTEEQHAKLSRKFAAAPEMYEALKAQEAAYQHDFNCENCQDGRCEIGQELRYQAQKLRLAALSKAEGGPTP